MLMGAALAWDDDHCNVIVSPGGRGTHLVNRIRGGKRERQHARVGAPDRSLTANAGLAAVTGLCDRLGVIEAIGAAIGPVKLRDRGFGAGELAADRDRGGAAARRGLPDRPGPPPRGHRGPADHAGAGTGVDHGGGPGPAGHPGAVAEGGNRAGQGDRPDGGPAAGGAAAQYHP